MALRDDEQMGACPARRRNAIRKPWNASPGFLGDLGGPAIIVCHGGILRATQYLSRVATAAGSPMRRCRRTVFTHSTAIARSGSISKILVLILHIGLVTFNFSGDEDFTLRYFALFLILLSTTLSGAAYADTESVTVRANRSDTVDALFRIRETKLLHERQGRLQYLEQAGSRQDYRQLSAIYARKIGGPMRWQTGPAR